MVNQNKGTIYTVCYMFSKDSDEVADLFQETLINLWKGMPEKDEISNIKGRIYRVSLNTCISLNRKKKSRLTVAEKIIKYKRFGNNWLKFSIPFLVLWVIVFFPLPFGKRMFRLYPRSNLWRNSGIGCRTYIGHYQLQAVNETYQRNT